MWTSKDVLVAVGMKGKKPTFDRWMAAGIARPSEPSRGSGHPARWDSHSIMALALTRMLGEYGLDLRKAADVAENAIMGKTILTAPDAVAVDLDTCGCLVDPWNTIEKFQKWSQGRPVIVIDVADIRQQIAKNLKITETELL